MRSKLKVRAGLSALVAIIAAAVIAACSKSAPPLAKDDSWRMSVNEWRAMHEKSYRENWATIAGLHFIEPGDYRIGSAKTNDIVLPASAPAAAGRVAVADDGIVRYQPAASIQASFKDQPITGTAVLREPGKTADEEVKINDVRFAVHESGKRLSIRVWDPNGEEAREFAGFSWFPVNPDYYVLGRFIPDAKPGKATVLNTYGDPDVYDTEGVIEFSLNGQTLRLRPFTTRPKRFYIVFKDASSGQETYETARFLYADLHDDGTVPLDFNEAYNPPCAFNPYTTCPIPLKENRLPVKILAGEKAYTGAHPNTEGTR